jgi:hypothetical protein
VAFGNNTERYCPALGARREQPGTVDEGRLASVRVGTVRSVRYGREAAEALRTTIAAIKGDQPLRPVSVVVPSNHVSVATRRLLAALADDHEARAVMVDSDPDAPGWRAERGPQEILDGCFSSNRNAVVPVTPHGRPRDGDALIDQSSARAAKSRLAFLYHPIPAMGCFHLPFIAFKALLCVSSPPATISFRCLSCSFITSSAVLPWSKKSHGPPNCLHVIVFMSLLSLYSIGRQPGRVEQMRDFVAPHRAVAPVNVTDDGSGLRDTDEVARGITKRAVARAPRLGRRLLKHLGA